MKTLDLLEIKKVQSDFPKEKIVNSKQASDFIRKFYSDDIEIYESAFILLLDKANNTIGFAKISQGGVSGTVIDPKIIAVYAVKSLASSVILAHNHPSGNLNPSNQDVDISKKTKEGMKFLDIQFIDSLIITVDNYFSLADNFFI